MYQLTGFGLAAVLANVFGGLLYGSVGSQVVFVLATILALGAAVLAYAVFPRTGEQVAREGDFEHPVARPGPPA
jgi:predicted MFS family arabinose efflux permease